MERIQKKKIKKGWSSCELGPLRPIIVFFFRLSPLTIILYGRWKWLRLPHPWVAHLTSNYKCCSLDLFLIFKFFFYNEPTFKALLYLFYKLYIISFSLVVAQLVNYITFFISGTHKIWSSHLGEEEFKL